MTAVELIAGNRLWRWSEVDPSRAAGRLRAVAFATILDDVTLAAPVTPLVAISKTAGFQARAGLDGMVGLFGPPFPLIPDATDLAGTPVAFDVVAAGFGTLSFAGALAADPTYPDSFAPLDFGTRRLVRRPCEIRGRVFRMVGGAAVPASGATISITAATPVPALAGATPAPPPASTFTAISATADTAGEYRLPPISRAKSLAVKASQGGGSVTSLITSDYADPVMLLDFRLP